MIRTFALAACVWLALCGAGAAQTYARNIELNALAHGGVNRTVGVYVPSTYDAARTAPVIVALHGRFSSAVAFHAMSHLARVAEERGAILVYPQTAGAFWNDGGHAALGRREPPQEDALFIAQAIAAVRTQYAVDPARVFLVGYDTGGSMAFKLACDGQIAFAGVAVVSALLWDYQTQTCASPRAAPMLILHGRQDDAFPVNGAEPPRGALFTATRLSVADTLAHWRRVNGCGERASATARGGSQLYAQCAGAPLAYVGLERGEHDWFRAGDGYRLNREGLDAAAEIGRFFFDRAGYTLPDARHSGPRSRSWFVYAPPGYDPARPMPLVVVLHGRPQNATGIALTTQMNPVAERNGFLVVYPEGLNNEWNAIHDITGRRSVAPQDDVGFLETLVEEVAADFNVDRRRTYVTGFSNGGFMTYRMACSSARFAGFAAVGANLYTDLQDECRGSRPIPILIMHGTADISVPYTGVIIRDGQGREPTTVSLSTPETVAFFIRRNGCSLSGAQTTLPERGQSPGSHVIRFAPHNCNPGGQVMFYLINGGGHDWPGVASPTPLPEGRGVINMDINAGQVIWDFFSQQALAQDPPPLRR